MCRRTLGLIDVMKREKIVQTIQGAKEDPTDFLALVHQHHVKEDPFDLEEFFQALPKRQHRPLWAAMLELAQHAAEGFSDGFEEDRVDKSAVSLLVGVAAFCQAALAQDTPTIPDEFRETVQLLHDILLGLSEVAPDLQNSISLLCEQWWGRSLGDGEGLVPHCLLYLVARTLVEGATLGDVHRVWQMRQAFLLLDFEDTSADSLKCMLLSCTLQPLYLRSEEGRKFLSFLFGLHPKFVEDLHLTIKNQLPHCPKSFLEVYGEVYFRAWRLSSGPYLQQLEEHCLQDLMFSAVHAPRQGLHSLFAALRKVLGYLHQQKSQKGVSEMLLRLYKPFIWRSLKVANPHVRANAATLLLDAFPLQDPDQIREEIDSVMQRQFDAITELLEDPVVMVRVAAVAGVCRVLSFYWEMIPASVLRTMLGRLVKDLAWDVSAVNVRVAVLQGLCIVMENRLSHPLMRELLPLLQTHLHDSSEKVRIAFLDLLLLVKGTRTVKFWHVCPIEHLLARMEVDSVHVVKRIVALLVDSFQPSGLSGAEQIERCIVLLRSNPGAARRFYQMAVGHLSPGEVARFILTIHSAILQCIHGNSEDDHDDDERMKVDRANDPEVAEEQEGSSPTVEPTGIAEGGWREEGAGSRTEVRDTLQAETGGADVLSLQDTDLMQGLLETMVVLWEGAKERLNRPANKTVREKLVKKISESLSLLFDTFKDGPSRSAIYLLSSYLPKKAVSDILKGTLQVLASLSYPTNSKDYTSILVALVAWQQASQVMKLTNQWLESEFKGKPATQLQPIPVNAKVIGRNKTRKGKRGGINTGFNGLPPATNPTASPQPMLALEMIDWMMGNPVCLQELKGLKEFWDLSSTVKKSMEFLEQHLSMECEATPPDHLPSFEILSRALSLYFRLHIHRRLEFEGQQEFISVVQEVLVWFDRVVLPCLRELQSSHPQRRSSRKRKTDQPHPPPTLDPRSKHAHSLVELLLQLLTEVTMIGLADEGLDFQMAQFAGSVAETASAPHALLPSLCKLLYQLCEAVGKSEEEGLSGIRSQGSLRPAAVLLERMLALLQRMADGGDQEGFGKAWSLVRPCVGVAVTMSVRLHSLSVTAHSLAVYSALVQRTVEAQVEHIKKQPTLEIPTSAEDLAMFVSPLLQQSCKDEHCTSLFAGHLRDYLSECSSQLPEVFLTHQAALHLTSALVNSRFAEGELMRCVRSSIRLVEGLSQEERVTWNGPVSEISSLIESLQERLFH